MKHFLLVSQFKTFLPLNILWKLGYIFFHVIINVFIYQLFIICCFAPLSSQIRIRDPNQGGKDITEEIMFGSRNPTPPAGHPASTLTPPSGRPSSTPTPPTGHLSSTPTPPQARNTHCSLPPETGITSNRSRCSIG